MRAAIVAIALSCLPLTAGVFEGRVVEDHNGNALSRVEIRITLPGADVALAELETDAQGRFRTPDFPGGPYMVRFSKTNFSTVQVATMPRAGMAIRLVHYGAIAGHFLRSDGSPVSDVYPEYVFAVTPTGARAGTTDRNARGGEYRIYDLLPGRYRVVTTLKGVMFQPDNSHPREFTVSGGEDYANADITFPPGAGITVSGKVEIAASTVSQVAMFPADLPTVDFGVGGETNGPFSIPRVLPGNYELLGYTVRGTPRLFGRMSLTVSGANIDSIVLPVNQSRSVTFVMKAAEACRSGVTVELTTPERWPVRTFPANLRDAAPVTVSGIPPAKYFVTASANEGGCFVRSPASIDLTKDSAAQPVELLLEPPGAIHGRITGAGLAVLLAPDGAQQIAFPDEKGEFTFGALRPGPYTVFAAGASTRWMPAAGREPPPIVVTSGTPVEVELKVPEAPR